MKIFYLIEALAAVWLGWVLLVLAERTVRGTGHTVKKSWEIRRVIVPLAVCQVVLAFFLPVYYGVVQQDLLRTLLMVSVLWACAWSDVQVCLIPNRVVLVGALGSLLLMGIEILQQPQQMLYIVVRSGMAAAALLVTALLCRAISPKAVGMGDVKILAVMGLGLGMDLVWPALFFSFALLFVVCVGLLITRKATRSDSVPFAPFLCVGTVLAAFLTGI